MIGTNLYILCSCTNCGTPVTHGVAGDVLEILTPASLCNSAIKELLNALSRLYHGESGLETQISECIHEKVWLQQPC